jgi:type II secretory pathway pseudopilin PulG
MMNRRRQSLVRKQRGFVLIALVALLVMGGLYFFISNLSPELIEARRQEKTSAALVQAREALIGYAVRFREEQLKTGTSGVVYGYLPLPDLGNTRNQNVGCTEEGCDAANFAGNAPNITTIGRFPWRTLGTGPLRDSDGECLWYAVSGSHQRIQQSSPMNWDTLSQLEIRIANGTAAMISAINSAHDQPIAVIFSPGPPLTGQDRSASATDSVTECGGNYLVTNYLDPVVATSLGGITNYLAGTNSASGDTSAANKALSANSIVNRRSDATLWGGNCPPNDPAPCAVVANDTGTSVTSELLFRTLRGSSFFRTDINTMLDRMVGCLRDEIIAAGGSLATPYAKVAGADNNTCYGTGMDPLGYYPNYKEMIFVAAPGSVTVTVDGTGQTCAGALLFAGQRDATTLRCPPAPGTPVSIQKRSPGAEQLDACNYLETPNLASFTGSGTVFAGPSLFAQVSASHSAYQDIARCIPSTASMVAAPSALPPGRELSQYNPATRTLTLGSLNVVSGDPTYGASTLFGCAWTPEARATGSGFRSYFSFYIYDTGTAGDGFVFALADGDANSASVCGAGRQHLGYSGNNGTVNSPILYPKIGIEFDTARNYRPDAAFTDPTGFYPAYLGSTPTSASYLNNGRADPNYHDAGHLGIVYWGGESAINTGIACTTTCTSPQYCSAGFCYLQGEEDDNVHGRSSAITSARPPPQNPVAPAALPTFPAGVYELTPDSSVFKGDWVHARIELTRTQPRTVAALADSNQALTGLPTIDGMALAAGSRLLLVAQTDSTQNGVWEVSAVAWSRAAAEDASGEIPFGTVWKVTGGTQYGETYWRFNTPTGFSPGTSSNTITQVPIITRDANSRPVRVATTSNQVLLGLPTIDDIAVQAGDRVLLTGQTAGKENGVWVAAAGAWTRATPEDEVADMPTGTNWIVREGTANAWSYWHLNNLDGYVLARTAADSGSALSISKTTAPWKSVATSNVTLSGLQTIGGIALTNGNWVLVAGQSTPAENGVYKVKAGAWERIPMYQDTFDTRAWVLKESVTDANRIASLKQVSRAMASLDGSYLARVADTATLYSPQAGACTGNAQCAAGQWCGIDNTCYRPAFRTLRLGFTNAQGTRDQIIDIKDFAATWLP